LLHNLYALSSDYPFVLADVCSCHETEEVPLYWELFFCTQFGGEGCVDLYEKQQLWEIHFLQLIIQSYS